MRVRVAVENLIHRTRFGEAGRVVAVSDGSALVELEAYRFLAPVISRLSFSARVSNL